MSELSWPPPTCGTGVSPDNYPTQSCGRTWTRWGAARRRLGSVVSDGDRVLIAGAVTHGDPPRQGVTFINLEDETGMVNVLCTPGSGRDASSRTRHDAADPRARSKRQRRNHRRLERMGRLTLAVGARSPFR